MKKEGIQTRKRKPKSSQGPTKEPKSSKNNHHSPNLQPHMQPLAPSHQYASYEPARDAAAKAILNYETGMLFTLILNQLNFIHIFFILIM